MTDLTDKGNAVISRFKKLSRVTKSQSTTRVFQRNHVDNVAKHLDIARETFSFSTLTIIKLNEQGILDFFRTEIKELGDFIKTDKSRKIILNEKNEIQPILFNDLGKGKSDEEINSLKKKATLLYAIILASQNLKLINYFLESIQQCIITSYADSDSIDILIDLFKSAMASHNSNAIKLFTEKNSTIKTKITSYLKSLCSDISRYDTHKIIKQKQENFKTLIDLFKNAMASHNSNAIELFIEKNSTIKTKITSYLKSLCSDKLKDNTPKTDEQKKEDSKTLIDLFKNAMASHNSNAIELFIEKNSTIKTKITNYLESLCSDKLKDNTPKTDEQKKEDSKTLIDLFKNAMASQCSNAIELFIEKNSTIKTKITSYLKSLCSDKLKDNTPKTDKQQQEDSKTLINLFKRALASRCPDAIKLFTDDSTITNYLESLCSDKLKDNTPKTDKQQQEDSKTLIDLFKNAMASHSPNAIQLFTENETIKSRLITIIKAFESKKFIDILKSSFSSLCCDAGMFFLENENFYKKISQINEENAGNKIKKILLNSTVNRLSISVYTVVSKNMTDSSSGTQQTQYTFYNPAYFKKKGLTKPEGTPQSLKLFLTRKFSNLFEEDQIRTRAEQDTDELINFKKALASQNSKRIKSFIENETIKSGLISTIESLEPEQFREILKKSFSSRCCDAGMFFLENFYTKIEKLNENNAKNEIEKIPLNSTVDGLRISVYTVASTDMTDLSSATQKSEYRFYNQKCFTDKGLTKPKEELQPLKEFLTQKFPNLFEEVQIRTRTERDEVETETPDTTGEMTDGTRPQTKKRRTLERELPGSSTDGIEPQTGNGKTRQRKKPTRAKDGETRQRKGRRRTRNEQIPEEDLSSSSTTGQSLVPMEPIGVVGESDTFVEELEPTGEPSSKRRETELSDQNNTELSEQVSVSSMTEEAFNPLPEPPAPPSSYAANGETTRQNGGDSDMLDVEQGGQQFTNMNLNDGFRSR